MDSSNFSTILGKIWIITLRFCWIKIVCIGTVCHSPDILCTSAIIIAVTEMWARDYKSWIICKIIACNFFLCWTPEWECSLGSLWTPSVDTSGGHSGTSAVQHSSCFESWTVRNSYCFWEISWNSCFTLAISGIHPGNLGFSVLTALASQFDKIVIVFMIHLYQWYYIFYWFLFSIIDYQVFHLVKAVHILKPVWK